MPDLVAHIARVNLTGRCEKELLSLGILDMSNLSFAEAADLKEAGLGAIVARALLSVGYEINLFRLIISSFKKVN
jgi:hypothetical protein